jgi:dihydropyrimidine dehydrogenase (NAD+) subunit PreT
MSQNKTDIAAGRLSATEYAANFADLHAPLNDHQALVESDRCYFCDGAPCTTACPTGIDIPMFIRQISTGNPKGAAATILRDNIMGGMCARVCPTETLCEEVCVRNDAENMPVKIGQLQRFATDKLFATGKQLFAKGVNTGKRIAVVGGGPAGLACAHALARQGHAVTVLEARDKLGGLNEYGIASYKTVDNFAQHEVDYILGVGGIDVKLGTRLGADVTLGQLRAGYDAVFLGLGLGAVNALSLEGEELDGVLDAVAYIAELRQAKDLAKLPVGRRIVVIGGGMTAIDIAVQTKRLGADEVTLVYRRGQEHMKASAYEQELAQTSGVKITLWAKPVRLLGEDGHVRAAEFETTRPGANGERFTLDADMVFKAIGQKFVAGPVADGNDILELDGGRIAVNDDRRTSLPDVWAGGDCISGGEDLTVAGVEDGKIAAAAIDRFLKQSTA